jgi:prophage maintenance system killer protein
LIRPTLDHAVAFNRSERREDEWFDEPDDLERVQRALDSIADLEDVVEAAAVLAYRVARAQGFGEGNKRTALLLARWLLDRNGENGLRYIPAEDRVIADLLVAAAGGRNVERELIDVLVSRRPTPT